ncbi:MAG: Ig-like domain-containing protein [Lepagella sp.]
MRRLLQRKLCRRKTLLFTLFLLSLIIGTTPASAKEVTDVLTNAGLINKTTTTYTAFSGKSFTSDAVYAGKIAGNYSSIQLNTTKSNNIVTTASGGTLKKIKVFWNSNTSKNSLQVYAQNSPYAASTTLSGTVLATLAYSAATTGSDSKKYTEYTFPEGSTYTYVAIAGGGGATYSDSIEITWEDGTAPDTRQDVTLSWSESAVSTNIGETFTAPTLTVNPADATSSLVYSSSDTSVAEIATDGTVTIKAVGQTTITAAIPDDNETYKPKSASYTLTVIDPNEVYYLVKTAADFDVTQECILVAYNNKDSYQAAMGAQNGTKYREAVPYSPIAASLPENLYAPVGTVPFTLEPGADSSTYYIKVGENTYLSLNSDGTDIKEVTQSATAIVLSFNDNRVTLQHSGDTRALGYNNSADPKRFAYYSTKDATYKNVYLYQKRSATPALGDITFSPAPGEVTRGTEVTISCNNATQLYYIFSYEETGNGHFVTGNSTTVTITQDCSIEVIATNASSTQKTILVNYTIKAAPICGDITFDPASGSEVEEGSDVSISCENAVKLTYTITKGDVTSELVEVEGCSTTVSVTEPCTLTVNAVNADNIAATQVSASYTIAPKTTYELVEAYNGNDIPEGNYIFASTTANGSFMMKGQEKDYRIADDVTITENKFGAYPRFEITVKKEDNDYYSLLTKEGKYIYATAERKVAETTETDEGKGKWQPEISGSTMKLKWVNGEQNFGSLQMYKSADSERFTTYTSSQAPISLYTVQTTKCGSVIFNPAPGSEVPINSTVKISCKNATQISYSITKNEGPSTTVVVPGSVAEVTITEDCIIEAYGTNDEGDSEIAEAIYTVQTPFTLYTDFYEETDAPYIPDGNYVLVGSVSSGESAGEYYMAEQKDNYRVANKIQPLEDGRLPIDNKYQINIKKEENGNYSLIVAEGKYIYAVSSITTSGEGESQTTTTTYSVKEGDETVGQGKWKANIEKGKVYFSWADDPSYGDFKFNPQSPRFKTYDPTNTNLVSFSLYSTNIPLCRDLKFDHADGSTVVRGSTVTISCINAAKIFYSVNSPSNFTVVEGNKASVIISDVCMITAYAENAAGVRSDEISAFYTVIDPYVQFTGYGSDGSVPDGKYLFVGQNATTGALSYMAGEDVDSNGSVYRNAVEVTPFEDGRIGVSESFAIEIKKEESGKYSLITADRKYLYAYSSTDPSGEGESQTTTTTYSVIGGDANQGQGQWTAIVADNKVEFAWSNPDMGTLRFNSGASRFKTYVGSTGTKFYLYAPTPKPAQVVCTDATIINDDIHIAVNKTITFKSEGAGQMACKVLDNSVETFDIEDGDTYTFTAASEATDQIITIIPYDKYGVAYEPSERVVWVHTYNLPKISYNFVDGEDKAAFYADNGTITEIRPYLIDGTLEAEALDLINTYPDKVIPFRFSQPRFKVTASNEYGDTVEENFSFIQELCDRNNMEGGAYSVVINYKDANSEAVASFPIEETELGSLNWTMDGYLVNESDDILKTYPFLIKESYITLHIAPYRADSPTILNVKIATPADGGEGVYGAPAHAPVEGDLVATVGNFNFVQNGGSHFYFDGQGKNFIKGNIEVSPFEYANIRITSIDDVTTEVSDILDEDAEEVFYNLQGVRVENPDKGIYIRVKGNKTEKILK